MDYSSIIKKNQYGWHTLLKVISLAEAIIAIGRPIIGDIGKQFGAHSENLDHQRIDLASKINL